MLTRGVSEFILLALDPVLEAFRIASCSGDFILHLLIRHLRRHDQDLMFDEGEVDG